jgi:ribosomal protein S12 methylthiotransferase accessory factor
MTTPETLREPLGTAAAEQPDAAPPPCLPPELQRLDELVSTEGGLIGQVARISRERDRIAVYSSTMGQLEHVQPNIRSTTGRVSGAELAGGGGGLHPPMARAISLAEALERYSSCVLPSDLVWATAEELGDRAVDLRTFPRCSEAELAHPACPTGAPDTTVPMRWASAWSLTDDRVVLVPAVAVWLHIPALTPAERFTMPISTGCAAHTDIHQALLSALCEVIERDAIALTWLQQLPLPEIEVDAAPAALAESLDDSAARGVRTRFFDATSELGVPTLYSVDEAPDDDRVRHVVMCATDLSPARAAVKVLRETASSRIALAVADPPPPDIDSFHSVFHGATYMGAPERSGAYDFLLRSDNGTKPFSSLPTIEQGSSRENLRTVLHRLATLGMDVYAVDMTTTEARRVGFRVVRVLVPALMPLSFTHRARYLGSRRLYSGPRAMGHPVRHEQDINPFPQPFA